MMSSSAIHAVAIAMITVICRATVTEIPLPRRLQACYNHVQNTGVESFVGSTFAWFCENTLNRGQDRDSQFDKETLRYFQHLYDEAYQTLLLNSSVSSGRRKSKRQAGRPTCVRREYRAMTVEERSRFHNAVNSLKHDTSIRPNKYDAIALIHAKKATSRAHDGPGFLGWHRIYILMFENALRSVDPSVCLPYWDTSLDAELKDPSQSSIWTRDFFGTSQGPVTDGPFANWTTPEGGPLVRNVGVDGELINAGDIDAVLSRSRYEDIVNADGTEQKYDIELQHSGVHLFCGGTMEYLETSPFDPIFYLLHSFIDYIWEQFRQKLRRSGVNPETYPHVRDVSSRHRASARTGLGRTRQRDGYRDSLAASYEYETSPICASDSTQCGSRHLRCDLQLNKCIATTYNEVETESETTSTPHQTTTQTLPSTATTVIRTTTPSPPLSTTPAAAAATTTVARTIAASSSSSETTSVHTTNITSTASFLPMSQMMSTTSIPTINSTTPTEVGSTLQMIPGSRSSPEPGSKSSPEPRPPSSDACVRGPLFGEPIQNDFCIDDTCDSDQWVTLPVKIIHTRPPKFGTYKNFPVHNGTVDSTSDIYSTSVSNQSRRQISGNASNPKTYKRCSRDDTIGQIYLTSRGINYNGYYKETAIVDNRLAVSISVGFINVKKPTKDGVTKVLVRAHDSCGRVCRVACKDPDAGNDQECPGAIALDNKPPLLYGDTYDEAVMSVFNYGANNDLPRFMGDNFFITFYCDYHSEFPFTKSPNRTTQVPLS